MPRKRVLRPERLRHVPAQFSWIDQRLVREGYLERCDAQALALYLLLVTVADSQGLSYYGDTTVCRLLSMTSAQLERARAALIGAGLIAYERPLYQVLALDPPVAPRTTGLRSAQVVLARLPAALQHRSLRS
jgi:hypothetical protein